MVTSESLEPHLRHCGYNAALVAKEYDFGGGKVPLAAFSDTPHDVRSVCIAVINANADPELAVSSIRPLGSPVVFACHAGKLQWWKQTSNKPILVEEPVAANQIQEFFAQHRIDFSPTSIFEGKTRGRLPGQKQLSFVDVGLMPFVERTEGERLSHLVEATFGDIEGELKRRLQSPSDIQNAIKATFWLLAAKALRDKSVEGFKSLNLSDIKDVFSRVGRHYNVSDDVPPPGRLWHNATTRAAERIGGFDTLRNLSTESLAHVYENALISPEVRKANGTHSTPGPLVDYMVWQLWPWIEALPPERRHIFEPACGHAAFLVSGLRMLRQWSGISDGKQRHDYLKKHLHGIEYDAFALEVARLSLTLADAPHGNTWDLKQGDMFLGSTLEDGAQKCGVLLANPPYEKFTSQERNTYAKRGTNLNSNTKACEMFRRTIPYLSEGACFGVVTPQGFLHSDEATELRRTILADFELSEIDVFEDKLFDEGQHEVAVLMARRKQHAPARDLWFRRVRNDGIEAFRDQFAFSSQTQVSTSRFRLNSSGNMQVPDCDEVWEHLATAQTLNSIAHVGQGFSFSQSGLIRQARANHAGGSSNGIPAILGGVKKTNIWELPPTSQVNLRQTPIRPWRSGDFYGKPQIIINYVRVMRKAWRIKAFLDPLGHATVNSFSTVRPRDRALPLVFVWAILNSPVANGYVYCHTMKKHLYDSLIGSVPLPRNWEQHVVPVVNAANAYLSSVRDPREFRLRASDDSTIAGALLEMDAAVLQAYELPPRLERQLLDLFTKVERKGVGCKFTGYYPAGFTSYLPLNILLSEHFQHAAADVTSSRFKPDQSAHVQAALAAAAGEE